MSALRAICFECIMENDGGLRGVTVERECKKDLRRHSLEHKAGHVFESEFLIVIRMPDQTTSLSVHVFEA